MAVKTYVKSESIQLSRSFNSREFRCGLGRTCNCTTTLIDDKLVEILQAIADYFGAKVTITSGYRCPSYNLSIGGAVGSYHSRGMAADITVDGVPPRAVAAYAQSIGVLGIGLYEGADGSFVHVDTRTYKSFWYGKKEEPRTSFGDVSVYERYHKKSESTSSVQLTQTAESSGTTVVYTVKNGDTLAKIAAQHTNVTYKQIADLNGIKAPYIIYVGQKLKIPCNTLPGVSTIGGNLSTTGSETSTICENVSIDYSKANYENSPDDLYWFLLDKIGNIYGACGLLANLNAESDLVAACLEGAARNRLGYTSKSYTDAVDSGRYVNFTNDCAGYGIAQWTDSPRKAALLAFAKKKSASIGNRRMQAEYLMEELNSRFTTCLNILKTATSVRQASNAVLMRFECPADQGIAVQNQRAAYAENYYKKFKDAQKPSGQASTDTVPYFCTVKADLLNVRSGPGINNAIVKRISRGAACTIVEEKDGWGRISNGEWVCLQYVTK